MTPHRSGDEVSGDRPVPLWVWPLTAVAWIPVFDVVRAGAGERSTLVQVLLGLCLLITSLYALRHCWTNPYLAFRLRVSVAAGILFSWNIAATLYLLWWQFHARTHLPPHERTIGEERQPEMRLQTLTSPPRMFFVKANLITSWVSIGLSVLPTARILPPTLFASDLLYGLVVWGPLFLGLSTGGVVTIWALRVVNALGEAVDERERLAWMVTIVATWILDATLAWLEIRKRVAESISTDQGGECSVAGGTAEAAFGWAISARSRTGAAWTDARRTLFWGLTGIAFLSHGVLVWLLLTVSSPDGMTILRPLVAWRLIHYYVQMGGLLTSGAVLAWMLWDALTRSFPASASRLRWVLVLLFLIAPIGSTLYYLRIVRKT